MSAPKATGLTPGVIDKTAPAPEFDPVLVEQAARAMHAERCCPCDPNGCGEPDPQDYSAARVVLTAVAPALMAQGAAKNALDRQLLASRLADRTDEVVRQRVEIATAYQRGKVEGAREVLAAVEAMVAEWGQVVPPLDPPRAAVSVLAAAREAVARIEGGA